MVDERRRSGRRKDDRRSGDPVVVAVPADGARWFLRDTVLEMGAQPAADLVIDLRPVHELPDPVLGLLVGVRAFQRARRRRLTLVCLADSHAEGALIMAGFGRQLVGVPG